MMYSGLNLSAYLLLNYERWNNPIYLGLSNKLERGSFSLSFVEFYVELRKVKIYDYQFSAKICD
jgi:hypothetical protein